MKAWLGFSYCCPHSFHFLHITIHNTRNISLGLIDCGLADFCPTNYVHNINVDDAGKYAKKPDRAFWLVYL